MDIAKVREAIRRVIISHREALKTIGDSQTKLLELGAVTGIAQHYRARGCGVRVENPKGRRTFVVKTSTRGFPWNFSRIVIERESNLCELHMNTMVEGAHGAGVYCVDVGVVTMGAIPSSKPEGKWTAVVNAELITFAEVKKLVVYPMLLAQFIGIVHEIKPSFLSGRGSIDPAHPSPTLIVLGHYSANARTVVDSYPGRGIAVTIAANYDGRLSRARDGQMVSPLDDQDVEF